MFERAGQKGPLRTSNLLTHACRRARTRVLYIIYVGEAKTAPWRYAHKVFSYARTTLACKEAETKQLTLTA